MTIREYAATVKKSMIETVHPPSDFVWRTAFEKKGYPSVLLGRRGHDQWQEVHAWCRQHFGEDHYCWTGSRFWFENEHDAVLFTLRWS